MNYFTLYSKLPSTVTWIIADHNSQGVRTISTSCHTFHEFTYNQGTSHQTIYYLLPHKVRFTYNESSHITHTHKSETNLTAGILKKNKIKTDRKCQRECFFFNETKTASKFLVICFFQATDMVQWWKVQTMSNWAFVKKRKFWNNDWMMWICQEKAALK